MGIDQVSAIQKNVVNKGICVGCGACVALDESGLSEMIDSSSGPIPKFSNRASIPDNIETICPGYGCNYPELYVQHYGTVPDRWLLGHQERVRTGYAADDSIRRLGASGGVLTRVLVYLLESGRVDGVIVAEQGRPSPLQARYRVATTAKEVIDCAQSIYIPVSMIDSLKEIDDEKSYAMVCLPDQSAALRQMQHLGDKKALQIKYVIGPYVGTSLQPEAINAFLKSNRIDQSDAVTSLKWRAGEWPGYLEIKTESGRMIRSKKVYYNYLIPFYVTQASLQSMDFANEFADLAVGEAWSPEFEKEGKGHSVIVTRSTDMEEILSEMIQNNLIEAMVVDPMQATEMHGHMLDFKKRGSYLRNRWRRVIGLKAPDFGYVPKKISLSRMLVEIVICSIFFLARRSISRKILQKIPERIMGPFFNKTRLLWKSVSKPTKRKGLADIEMVVGK